MFDKSSLMSELQLIWFLMRDIGRGVVKQDGKCVISMGMGTAGRECILKGI